jgi:tRNA(adenine34) deaminase
MKIALELAQKSADEFEVPVGAVIVKDEKILATGRNTQEKSCNALMHAEIIAINKACKNLNSWRLFNCEIFVTLEPCSMCAGAIINSRIKRLIFGAHNPKFGAVGSVVNLFDMSFNHKPEIISGVLEKESKKLLIDFFHFCRNK